MSRIQNVLISAIALTLLNSAIARADESPASNANLEIPGGSSISQQAEIIQNSNVGNSTLHPPGCAGSCIFAMTRMNNHNSVEAIAGVVWQLNSPQGMLSKAQRDRAQAQNEKLIQESNTALAEKLADAIEAGKPERANLLAIILAKRLGYSDPQQLLREVNVK